MIGAVALLLSARSLSAQAGCDTTRSPWTFLRQCFSAGLPQGDTVNLARGLHTAVNSLRNPSSLNPALAELAEVTGTRRFIGALQLHFVSAQQGDDHGLALAYDWHRDIVRTPHRHGEPHGGFRSGLEARGLLVPSGDDNPQDFDEFAWHASFFYGRGGAASPALMRAHLAGIADSAEAYRPRDAYIGSPAYLKYMAGIWDSLSTQLYLTGGLEARYETNQRGDRTQWASGVRMGVDVKIWNPHSRVAPFNIFDWPTALIRWASGADSSFRPSGSAIPTVSVMYHRISPVSNAARDSVHNLEPFPRLAVELRWRTKLSAVEHQPVWLSAEFRQHLELNADPAITGAGMHRHSRIHLQVDMPTGLTLSWAKGNLPFTQNGDDRWGVGFQLKYR